MEPEAAMRDFLARIDAYKKVYEPVSNDEGTPFIRLTNAGEELLCHQCTNYTLGRVAWLMGSMRLMSETQPVVIISHLGVLRVIYSYLMGVEPSQCPYLELPMHCIIQLHPKGFGYEEWRHFPL
eukprot:TRINITY_DN14585_c0_g1_i2.p1 TRINITY_DN14585_c0_g1~~TRINITY_DN14585_c0_g1_i2.p1  ORF type:complete len:124 (-),score=36.81 TRINITY_DN14585_c0_g1_i2:1025-1396(-)